MMKTFVVVATLVALVLCEMDHSNMNMPMVTEGSVCSQVKDSCANCTALGCNWCSAGMGLSFCTDIADREEAGCTMDGCSADSFIKKTPECFGGCSALDTCSHCNAVPGCGWCHQSNGGSIGCMETMDGMIPESCSVFTVGTCELPCTARYNCKQCISTGSQRCEWCHETGVCDFVGFAPSGCVNNAFELSQCTIQPVVEANKQEEQSTSEEDGKNEDGKQSDSSHFTAGVAVIGIFLIGVVYVSLTTFVRVS